MPDEAVAATLLYAVHDTFDGIDLIGAHHEYLLLRLDKHHIAADELAQFTLGQHHVGEGKELHHLAVVAVGGMIDGQVAASGIEVEMLVIVVGKIHRVAAPIADDEELYEAHQRIGVAVAAILLVAHNLLHGLQGRHAVALQLDLHQGQAVHQDDDVVAMMAIGGVHVQLIDDLVVVLAPVAEVDEAVVERGAVVAYEGLLLSQVLRGCEHIGGDVLLQQLAELVIRERHEIETLELCAEISFERIQGADVAAIGIVQLL